MKKLRAMSSGLLALAITFHTQAGDKKNGAPPEPPPTPVSKPVQRLVADAMDYTGRTSAKESVTIQPRVTGFLVKIAFKEGADVKQGDVLFEIDPRPYQAQLRAADASLAQAEATFMYASVTNARFKALAKAQPGVVSERELAQYQAQEQQAAAGLELAKANVQSARLTLDWTVVRSPIAGRAGRHFLTVGNLVKQDETKLTTVISMDPMYVHFAMEERTLQRIRKAINDGKPGAAKEEIGMSILMGLAGDDGFPHRGTVSFVDSQVNPTTGTLSVRAVIANPKPKDGVPLMVPGMFVRVRLLLGSPHEALLVSDRAIGTDQARKFVYVLDSSNKAEYREVKLGRLEDDGLRVILDGLKKDETVVVGGLQQIRAGMTIRPMVVAMPTLK